DALRLGQGFRTEVVVGHEVDQLTVEEAQDAELPTTEPLGALNDRLEYWLNVGRGAGNYAEDFARGRLLLQRLRQIGVAGLQLPEQRQVLDGDEGWVGEGLQQRDLVIGEPARLTAGNTDRPDGLVVAQHRHDDLAPEATNTGKDVQRGKSGIAVGIRDVKRHAFADGVRVRPLESQRLRESRSQRLVAGRVDARDGAEFEVIARKLGERAAVALQEP